MPNMSLTEIVDLALRGMFSIIEERPPHTFKDPWAATVAYENRLHQLWDLQKKLRELEQLKDAYTDADGDD